LKISAEIREGNRITKLSADFEETEKTIKSAAEKVESFLKKTFKVESFKKEETKETQTK
jgi:hypothetical protein